MQFGWNADEETSIKILNHAYDEGINFIDTADIYSVWDINSHVGKSEKIIGNWLSKSNVRDEVIIASKVGESLNKGINDIGLSHRHISRQIENSLRNLNIKWIDLYQTHLFDEQTDIRTTLSALTELIQKEKVCTIGCSNYPTWRIVQALWIAEKYFLEPFSTIQTKYSLLSRSDFENNGISEICTKYNLGVISYSPLAYGFLSGKYQPFQPFPESVHTSDILEKYYSHENWQIITTLNEIAQNKGCLVAQIALAWVLQQKNITAPVIGVRTIEQLNELLEALNINFHSEEYKLLDQVSRKNTNNLGD